MKSKLQPSLQLNDQLRLRSVTLGDYPFLRGLYRDVRSQELSVTGWPQAHINAFCDSQFDLQDTHYREHYPCAHFYVIEQHGTPVGRVYVSDAPEILRLMEVSLVASRRGQGVGGTLMHWLAGLSDASQRPIELHVEPENPARRLYERFGFITPEPQAQSGVYLRMRRAPILQAA
ncbi:MAG: GNAT family N-acetyltransferase [Comamonas sp.]